MNKVHFGDGLTGTGRTPSHTYFDNGTYTVSLAVADAEGLYAFDTLTVAVSNAVPTPKIVSISDPRLEGTAISVRGSASDPARAKDTIGLHWVVFQNDSLDPYALGSGSKLTFVPVNDGEYRMVFTASDEDFGSSSEEVLITVDNVNPDLLAVSATSANENGTVTLSGTYGDVGTQDTHTLTINWGEGEPETVTVSGGSFSFPHHYLDDNPMSTSSDIYTIGVTLTDDDGGSLSTRRSNISGSGSGLRLNDDYFFKIGAVATIVEDLAADVLTGSSGVDWFLLLGDDDDTDFKANQGDLMGF